MREERKTRRKKTEQGQGERRRRREGTKWEGDRKREERL